MNWKKCAKIWPKKLSESTRWLKQEVPRLICLRVASAKRRTVHTPRYMIIHTLSFHFSKLKSYVKIVREKSCLYKMNLDENVDKLQNMWRQLDLLRCAYIRNVSCINLPKILCKSKLRISIAWNVNFLAMLSFWYFFFLCLINIVLCRGKLIYCF